jgi:hypothetical protein
MKTIEEAAKELANVSMLDFIAGAEFAQRWIPVEESLPESEEILTPVLIQLEGKYIKANLGWMVANFDKRDNKFHALGLAIKYEKVTHWRPITLK